MKKLLLIMTVVIICGINCKAQLNFNQSEPPKTKRLSSVNYIIALDVTGNTYSLAYLDNNVINTLTLGSKKDVISLIKEVDRKFKVMQDTNKDVERIKFIARNKDEITILFIKNQDEVMCIFKQKRGMIQRNTTPLTYKLFYQLFPFNIFKV